MKKGKAGKRRIYTYLIDILAVVILIAAGRYAFFLHENARAETDVGTAASPFELTMLDVGQGLSILIEADGEYMLYDGGDYDSAEYVVSYLRDQGVRRFRYIVASHHDMDHVGGLIEVLGNFSADTVLSADYEADTWSYRQLMRKIASSGARDVRPSAGDIYPIGNTEFEVLSPASYENEYENNNSIVIRITYGNFSALITGDAEYEAEKEMLDAGYTLKSDLYVVGHHGSQTSSSYAFVEAVSPKYALISVGEENDFGHPSERTLARLEDIGARLYRTDKQGTIVFHTDGEKYWFNTAPSDDWSAGYRTASGMQTSIFSQRES